MNQVFEMHLQEVPFKLISNGLKTVEMRLNNKNRDKISKGDFIVFHNSYNEETIKVIVTSVSKFPTFKELYESYPKQRLGYQENEVANPDDMLKYYQREDTEKYGVLAIEISLVK